MSCDYLKILKMYFKVYCPACLHLQYSAAVSWGVCANETENKSELMWCRRGVRNQKFDKLVLKLETFAYLPV